MNCVDTNPDDYIDFDREVSTTHIEMSDKDILDEVTGQSQNVSEDEEENVHDDIPAKPNIKDVRNAIDVLGNLYSIF